ncbi:uncharacterized protein HKW66_Vig0257060 [Vigna angularis]|uniref:Uncharacterized protein n=1 Tax=Phaseolus angularis TaxID=3914 RepID=A0A8T0JT43_PHAAN|nr:uncharacterized protein HKW66_Vig0257060 [Vigna angularis]
MLMREEMSMKMSIITLGCGGTTSTKLGNVNLDTVNLMDLGNIKFISMDLGIMDLDSLEPS